MIYNFTATLQKYLTHANKEKIKIEVKSLLRFAFCFLLVIMVSYQPFTVPTGSMISTILEGDYLLVNKFAYGYGRFAIPFAGKIFPTSWSGGFLKGRIWHSDPKRGDVVVFNNYKDNGIDYIKRLIGLPGDKIQIIKGVLHINDQPVTLKRIENFSYIDRYDRSHVVPQYIEKLPNGVEHLILKSAPFGEGKADDTEAFIVPQDHYFCMGDNRDDSIDSRYLDRVGYVHKDYVIGRADIFFFSTKAKLYKPWEWLFLARFERIFKLIK